MTELVTVESWGRIMAALGVLGLPLGLLAGVLLARRRGAARGLRQGLALGLAGPLAWLLWVAYQGVVRVEPRSGYVGLTTPGVILALVLAAVGLGAAAGLAYRRLAPPRG